MRISVTDRCNLRCKYCMPKDVKNIEHDNIMRYEEIMRICSAATQLGISNFKVTGGEPLVRRGCVDFIRELKRMPGVDSVTLTTNGVLLGEDIDELAGIGIDGINISLDAVNGARFMEITGFDRAEKVISTIRRCVQSGIKTKVNTVMMRENEDQLISIAMLAENLPVDVRFIELMPIGHGRDFRWISADNVLARLRKLFPDLHYVDIKNGNGPASYYETMRLCGRIGIIGANSHKFCADCNRVRLTSTGVLKPCLCYESGVDMRQLIRSGATDEELVMAIAKAIHDKPAEHCFDGSDDITEHRLMSQIGG